MLSSSPSSPPPPDGPAYYARPRFLRRTRGKEWWTVLHPPYTMLHLSLVTIGACLTGPVNAVKFVATLLAFFLAVGVGAHSLDELHGRPLKTTIPSWQLISAAAVGLGGAVALGIIGMFLVSPYLAIFIVVGVLIALGYNLEFFDGRLHTTSVLILGWGAFPILTAYFAQHHSLSVASLFAATFGALVTKIQQLLSAPARDLRRRAQSVSGEVIGLDGSSTPITRASLLQPLERALRTLCWTGATLACSLVLLRFLG